MYTCFIFGKARLQKTRTLGNCCLTITQVHFLCKPACQKKRNLRSLFFFCRNLHSSFHPEELAKDAFSQMDVHLDPRMQRSLDLLQDLKFKEYTKEYSHILLKCKHNRNYSLCMIPWLRIISSSCVT